MIRKTMLKPEMLIPRLGDLLIEKGIITHGALEFCLKKQAALKAKGDSKLLGQILVEEGLTEEDTLNSVITEQIVELRNALINANQKLEERVRARTHELEKALKQLEDLNQTKSRIIANLSHELRTPLNHMKGYLELLGTGSLGCLNQEQVEAIKVTQKSYNKLEQLINELLQYSEASQGTLSLKLEPISILEFMETSIKTAIQRAKEREITIKTKLPTTKLIVLGDREKLTDVMNHVLDNALKFTQAGGTITIQAEQKAHEVSISVSDNGIGIPEERVGEVFEPFHQLDETTARRYGGTGLGLSIVKQILDAHKAKYSIESKASQGTEFKFLLPVCK